jgi:PAS domain S-box-containing protein
MTPARILILEDDRVVARDIQQQLQKIGHEVLGMAAYGEDAVALALETRPDVVLMDIRLGGRIDGIEAANEIRRQCQRPVIFLTAYSDDETVLRASRAEPFGYLLKPFEDSQLRTVIEMALYKHAAERQLGESERRYATTLSSIGDAVIATDPLSRVSFMNPVAIRLTGWTSEDAIGRPVSEVFRIVNEETREVVEDPAARALRLGTTVEHGQHTLLLARDGCEYPIADCGSPIIDDRGATSGAVLVFRDMTRQHQLDEELREAQLALARVGRLSAMGELSMSIAHEVNQPLTAIVANAAACVQWLTAGRVNESKARQAAQAIVNDGRRAGEVIASIRALARKAPTSMAAFNLNGAVREVLALLRGELRRCEITAETCLAPEAGLAFGDGVQLRQVILNLMMNSIDAIRLTEQQPRLMQISTEVDPTGYVLVAISDTGVGLNPALRERVFDPFFTTKPDGVGLGLSICRSIVEAHGGRLWASDNELYGCVFRFTVPSKAHNGTQYDGSSGI